MTYHRKCKEPGCYRFVVAIQEASCYKCAHGLTPKAQFPFGWFIDGSSRVTYSNETTITYTTTWEAS